VSQFSYIHSCFYALHSRTHIAIQNFSLKILVWRYSNKTNIPNYFHFESVKSFSQSNQKVKPLSNVYEFTFHEQKIKVKTRVWNHTCRFHMDISVCAFRPIYSEFLNCVILSVFMLQIFNSLQCFPSLLAFGVVCGYTSLIVVLIAIACTQFDKLKAAILDIRQPSITSQRWQKDEQDHTIASCDLQANLNACIRHHQNIIE